MRILHLSTRLILGGSQENTVLSCEGQSRLGHEVHLAFGPIYGPEGSMLPRVKAFNRGLDGPDAPERAGMAPDEPEAQARGGTASNEPNARAGGGGGRCGRPGRG